MLLPPEPWSQRWIGLDRRWTIALHRGADHRRVLTLLVLASGLGDGVLWYVLIPLLMVFGDLTGRACALTMLAVGSVNVVLHAAIKRRVCRPRPFVACDGVRACARVLDPFSFPSGHVLHAVAYAMVLSHYLPAAAVLAWPFAVAVAASRVVLGLHYPSDVLAGALLGLATGSIALLWWAP